MGIFSDYLTFVNDLLMGGKMYSFGKDKKITEIFKSNNVIEATQRSLTSIIMDHTQNINQNVFVEKNITVDCGSEPLQDFHLNQFNGPEYDFWGNEIKGSKCPSFGCCYDIHQSSKIKLDAINSSVLEEKNKMFNTIKQKLTQNVNMTVGGGKNLEIFNDTVSKSKNDVINIIEKILVQGSSIDVHSSQDLTFKSIGPLKCVNKCDETPSAGKIKQSLNVDIISQNIATSSFNIIHKNLVNQSINNKTAFSDFDKNKLMIFSAMFIIHCILIYTIIYVIVFYVGILILKFISKGRLPLDNSFNYKDPITHIVTIIVIYFIKTIYKLILCVSDKSLFDIWWDGCTPDDDDDKKEEDLNLGGIKI